LLRKSVVRGHESRIHTRTNPKSKNKGENSVTFSEITYDLSGHVLTITLNRPARLNAWTDTMERELRTAIETAEKDVKVRSIVITGAGRGFCAGADMDALEAATSRPTAAGGVVAGDRRETVKPSIEENYRRRFSYMLRVKEPIVAAINGPIAGMGLCMSLFCDMRYMADGAKLTTAFSRRGLIAEHGASWMLPRLIGPMNAMDLLFSARPISAVEADKIGLVRVLPSDGFLANVQLIASELTRLASPRSIGVIKKQVYDSLFQSLAEAWDIADEEMAKSLSSDDFKEGVAHFVEKREPNFCGR
jgi:enoyl-CoA hydratase/carnithine racemase